MAISSSYYGKRAAEYEQIYHKPERQADLAEIRHWLAEVCTDKMVLEIGCGTGYWTHLIAPYVQAVHALDIEPRMLALAQQKIYPDGKVSFHRLDMWDIDQLAHSFECIVVGFVWSHILTQQLPTYLALLLRRVSPGGQIILLDNRYVPGSNTPISREDEQGNTYQLRTLSTGETFEVLKNFPTQSDLLVLAQELGLELHWHRWTYFWQATLRH